MTEVLKRTPGLNRDVSCRAEAKRVRFGPVRPTSIIEIAQINMNETRVPRAMATIPRRASLGLLGVLKVRGRLKGKLDTVEGEVES